MAKEGFKIEATFADKLRAGLRCFDVFPAWSIAVAYELSFSALLLKEALNPTCEESPALIEAIRASSGESDAVRLIREFLQQDAALEAGCHPGNKP